MRVLIVEDEGLIARFVARGLQAEGYTTASAGRGDCLPAPTRGGVGPGHPRPAAAGPERLRGARELSPPPTRCPCSCCRHADRWTIRWRRWTRARPTSWPSCSRSTSCWRGCGRCFAAAARRPSGSRPEPDLEFTLDGPSRSLYWGDGRTCRCRTRVGLLEYLVRSPNEIVSRERILSAVWEYHSIRARTWSTFTWAATSQAAPRDPDRDRPRRRLPAERAAGRQRDRERGAGAGSALGRDRAPVRLYHRAHDREPLDRRRRAGSIAVNAVEASNTWPGASPGCRYRVAHREHHLVPAAASIPIRSPSEVWRIAFSISSSSAIDSRS